MSRVTHTHKSTKTEQLCDSLLHSDQLFRTEILCKARCRLGPEINMMKNKLWEFDVGVEEQVNNVLIFVAFME